MLEGGGKTPILNPLELEEIGFKIVAYPLSLIGVSMRAIQVRLFSPICGKVLFNHTWKVFYSILWKL